MTGVFIAAAAFGLEGVVKRELNQMGFEDATGEQGGARFTADMAGALRANLRLRCADRVLWLLAEHKAVTFTELFDLAQTIAWEDILPADARFPVTGHCARSTLMSERDCQSIIKKAVADRLMKKRGITWCAESGAEYAIRFALSGDMARIMLNTSGDALNKRGYRVLNGEAAIRETLAAAMIAISPIGNRPIYDPCCGTGTLLIEAAMRRARIAPGLQRRFAMENWNHFISSAQCRDIRQAETDRVDKSAPLLIGGSDIDENALSYCRTHIRRAGLEGRIDIQNRDLRDLTISGEAPFFLCNPPYGERMGERRDAEKLYIALRALYGRHPGCAMGVITSHPGFERIFGMRATQKRRLYNGRLECDYMVFMPR